METDTKYYLVERTLLPEVFRKVVKANAALHTGKAKPQAKPHKAWGCRAVPIINIKMASARFMKQRITAPSMSI